MFTSVLPLPHTVTLYVIGWDSGRNHTLSPSVFLNQFCKLLNRLKLAIYFFCESNYSGIIWSEKLSGNSNLQQERRHTYLTETRMNSRSGRLHTQIPLNP
jgi:hypothetical protein